MQINALKITCVALAAALACTATAETKINDNFSVFGYVVGSVQGTRESVSYTTTPAQPPANPPPYLDPTLYPEPFESRAVHRKLGPSDWTMDMDAMLIGAKATFDNVSGVVSIYSRGGNGTRPPPGLEGYGRGSNMDPVILDAYVAYDAGNGVVVTMGNFLSSLGYEPFHIIGSNAITSGGRGNLIPAYSTGAKVTVTRGSWTSGIAVKDSIRNDNPLNGPIYYKGDGELDEGAGVEAFVKFQQDAVTAFLGVAYDNGNYYDNTTGDLWVQYVINATTLAAEFCYQDGGKQGGDDCFWLVSARQAMGDWALAARISGGNGNSSFGIGGFVIVETFGENVNPAGTSDEVDTWMVFRFDSDFLKGTIAATYTVTQNLEIVAEYSCTDLTSGRKEVYCPQYATRSSSSRTDTTSHFGGVQFRFHY